MRRLFGALCAMAAACGPSAIPGGPGFPGGPVPPPRAKPTGLSIANTIDAAGGSVSLTASDGGSLTVTVPAGAVQAVTTFTIDQIATDPAVLLGAVGSGYRLGSSGTTLAKPLTLSFVPPTGVSPQGLTAAYQGALGYWFRVYVETTGATSVSVQTTFIGDWSLVTVATQRDLRGNFSLSSTQGSPSFGATGSVTLQYLGGDATSGEYMPQGTITLTVPVTTPSGAHCTSQTQTMDLPASLAEIVSGRWFRWGINGQWSLTCDDGSRGFVSTNFDTLGITNIGCTRAYSGAYSIGVTQAQGTYVINCGTAGSVTATWNLGP